MSLLIEKYLVHRCTVKLSALENRSKYSITRQIMHELDTIDPEVDIPRDLKKVRSNVFLVRSKIRALEAAKQKELAKPKLIKYVMVRHPQSLVYMAQYPYDCKMVLDTESVMTVMVPEHLL